jgi:hypothetical protein
MPDRARSLGRALLAPVLVVRCGRPRWASARGRSGATLGVLLDPASALSPLDEAATRLTWWTFVVLLPPRRSDGTGRRAGLKIRCPQGREGSSPSSGIPVAGMSFEARPTAARLAGGRTGRRAHWPAGAPSAAVLVGPGRVVERDEDVGVLGRCLRPIGEDQRPPLATAAAAERDDRGHVGGV